MILRMTHPVIGSPCINNYEQIGIATLWLTGLPANLKLLGKQRYTNNGLQPHYGRSLLNCVLIWGSYWICICRTTFSRICLNCLHKSSELPYFYYQFDSEYSCNLASTNTLKNLIANQRFLSDKIVSHIIMRSETVVMLHKTLQWILIVGALVCIIYNCVAHFYFTIHFLLLVSPNG